MRAGRVPDLVGCCIYDRHHLYRRTGNGRSLLRLHYYQQMTTKVRVEGVALVAMNLTEGQKHIPQYTGTHVHRCAPKN